MAVLGVGRVGRVIARDLAESGGVEVTVADQSPDSLEHFAARSGCRVARADLSKPQDVRDLAARHDLVVDALPGAMGLATVRAVIEAGKPCVDISFMPEDPRFLDTEAKRTGATVVYDMGVAPGTSNVLIAASARKLGKLRQVSVVVGGLPYLRRQPWEYAAPFSPADVMEEYVRPARIKVGGQVVERPALSGVEQVELPEVGTLEAFYTDGLRSLLDTVECSGMEEKTLRYPGYAERIKLLRDSGFLDTTPVDVNGILVRPRDVTLKLLDPAWRLEDKMEEFTAMRISIVGGTEPPYKRMTWNLLDRTDRDRAETSMARTTGFPAAILARGILDGSAGLPPGVHPPEALALGNGFVETLLHELGARGVHYRLEER
ncbi:MAG: saccharopine dehydrogenase C-terminal domain-containing protein [Deltaproteobacteria bacterium]|nr:saccharopine dehydrogenase C-terminal domain-containing protein [Deltaproteobacteria bacterium]